MRRLVLAAMAACVFGASAVAVEAPKDGGLVPCGLELSASAPAGSSGFMLAQVTLPSAADRQAACRQGCDDRARAGTGGPTATGIEAARQQCVQACNTIR